MDDTKKTGEPFYNAANLAPDDLASNVCRSGPPAQMLEMAKRFDLSAKDIKSPRWRAFEITKTCRHCDKSDACFDFLLGVRDERFHEADCPNAERYCEAALEK